MDGHVFTNHIIIADLNITTGLNLEGSILWVCPNNSPVSDGIIFTQFRTPRNPCVGADDRSRTNFHAGINNTKRPNANVFSQTSPLADNGTWMYLRHKMNVFVDLEFSNE